MKKLLLSVAALALASCSSSTSGGKAPDKFRVKFETTKGDVVIDCVRQWSPLGADRFHELVASGFYDGARFFRIVPGFIVQVGIKGDLKIDAEWREKNIPDDPAGMTNAPATVTFAKSSMPNSRTTQIFINLGDNARLDSQGFTPFGRVAEGMQVVTSFNTEYGEAPNQGRVTAEGNAYLQREFPRLDYIKKASIVN